MARVEIWNYRLFLKFPTDLEEAIRSILLTIELNFVFKKATVQRKKKYRDYRFYYPARKPVPDSVAVCHET